MPKMPPPLGLARAISWALGMSRVAWGASGKWLVALSHHTGVPVVLLAAVALVLSYRMIRRASRLFLEVFVALAVVVVATRLGWIHW